MKTGLKRLAAAALAGVVLAAPVMARADDDDDHDLARDLYEHGKIHALADILRIVGRQAPGEVVSVDLVQAGDKWVYRVQVVAANGRRTIVDVDAGKGALMRDENGK